MDFFDIFFGHDKTNSLRNDGNSKRMSKLVCKWMKEEARKFRTSLDDIKKKKTR
jgi:hypothetical protein